MKALPVDWDEDHRNAFLASILAGLDVGVVVLGRGPAPVRVLHVC